MTTTCTACGKPLSESFNLEGICPRCLLEASRDPDPVPPDAPAPERLAALFPDLEIEACLGRGGMGAVYRVHQLQLDRPAALKIMLTPPIDGAAFSERFFREARALARLDHPGVVKVYDVGETEGQAWILMEYVDGANLRTLLRERAITPTLALSIVRQVCEALQSAHQLGIVHRDIKPENVLLDRYGHAKLVDFGLAKLRAGLADLLTRSQLGLGTLHYAAPEQTLGAANVDARADVYSLGVLCYELLTGELPLGRFELPAQRAGLGKEFDDVILRAMERNPERRQRDAGELQREIERATQALHAVAEKLGEVAGARATKDAAAEVPAPAPVVEPVAVAPVVAESQPWTTPAWYGMLVCAAWVVVATLLRWDDHGRWNGEFVAGRSSLWTFSGFEDGESITGFWMSLGLLGIAGAHLAGLGRTWARGALRFMTLVPLVTLALSVVGMCGLDALADLCCSVSLFWGCDGANPASPLLMIVALVGLLHLARSDRRAVRDPALRTRLAQAVTRRRLVIVGVLPVVGAIALQFLPVKLHDCCDAATALVKSFGAGESPQYQPVTEPQWYERTDFGGALAALAHVGLTEGRAIARSRVQGAARIALETKLAQTIEKLVVDWARATSVQDSPAVKSCLEDEAMVKDLMAVPSVKTVVHAPSNGFSALAFVEGPGAWVASVENALLERLLADGSMLRTEDMKREFSAKLHQLAAASAAAAEKATAALVATLPAEPAVAAGGVSPPPAPPAEGSTPPWIERQDFGEVLATVGSGLILGDRGAARTRADADARVKLGAKLQARLQSLVRTWAKETGDVLDDRVIAACLGDEVWMRRLTDVELSGAQSHKVVEHSGLRHVLTIVMSPDQWVRQVGAALKDRVLNIEAAAQSEAVKSDFATKLDAIIAREAEAAARATAELIRSLEPVREPENAPAQPATAGEAAVPEPRWEERTDFGAALAVVGAAKVMGSAASARTSAEADARAKLGMTLRAHAHSLVHGWAKETGGVVDELTVNSYVNGEMLMRQLTDPELSGARPIQFASRQDMQHVLTVVIAPDQWVRRVGAGLKDAVSKAGVFQTEVMRRDFEDKLDLLIARDAKIAADAIAALVDQVNGK